MRSRPSLANRKRPGGPGGAPAGPFPRVPQPQGRPLFGPAPPRKGRGTDERNPWASPRFGWPWASQGGSRPRGDRPAGGRWPEGGLRGGPGPGEPFDGGPPGASVPSGPNPGPGLPPAAPRPSASGPGGRSAGEKIPPGGGPSLRARAERPGGAPGGSPVGPGPGKLTSRSRGGSRLGATAWRPGRDRRIAARKRKRDRCPGVPPGPPEC